MRQHKALRPEDKLARQMKKAMKANEKETALHRTTEMELKTLRGNPAQQNKQTRYIAVHRVAARGEAASLVSGLRLGRDSTYK